MRADLDNYFIKIYKYKEDLFMKKILLIVGAFIAVVLIGVIVFFATKKEPGTITLSVTSLLTRIRY